jgi:hypothetical protein
VSSVGAAFGEDGERGCGGARSARTIPRRRLNREARGGKRGGGGPAVVEGDAWAAEFGNSNCCGGVCA